MVGWHPQLNGHEFENTLGVGDGQEAWRAAILGVAKSQIRPSNCTELNTSASLFFMMVCLVLLLLFSC